MSLHLPISVIKQMRQEFAEAVLRNVTIEDPRARECTAALQRLDPRLFMVKAHDRIEAGTPVVAGFYHLLARNDDAPLSVIPIHADGEYVEPNSRVFERLAAGDLSNPDVFRAVSNIERDAIKAADRERELNNEQRQYEVRAAVNAATRASVSMNRDYPWAQDQAGRRAIRAKEAKQ